MLYPIQLKENTLGGRQKELNLKINEAVHSKVPFEEIKDRKETCDVDKLFKIDLASECKNVDYIIETLKSGDTLYISRALKKCKWLYNEEYSNIISPDNLHNNVFPSMSARMKHKMLTIISTNLKDEKRAEGFFEYCLNSNLNYYAFKFLKAASIQFKEDIIKNKCKLLQSIFRETENIAQLVGKNISLAEFYLETIHWRAVCLLRIFPYLYGIDPEWYLNSLEKYVVVENSRKQETLGKIITKDVVKKHKNRVKRNPLLYFTVLNNETLAKHTTPQDAKEYAVALLPETAELFWEKTYLVTYKHLLNTIPFEIRYQLIKGIFETKYPDSVFEMSENFYNQEYYLLMTTEEREAWALRHLATEDPDKEDQKYLWYRFVNYETAFPMIKQCILKTADAYERAKILNVLVKSVRNQTELEKLLNYYIERHMNEMKNIKINFLQEVIEHHDVFKFDKCLWTAFLNLLYSINAFDDEEFLQIALLYYISHDLECFKELEMYKNECDITWYRLKKHLNRLTENKEKIYYFLMQMCVKKLESLEQNEYDDEIRRIARKCIDFMQKLQEYYKKADDDRPEIMLKYMQLDAGHYYPAVLYKLCQSSLLRYLKQDASLVIKNLPVIKHNIENIHHTLKMNTFLNKLKTYFPSDVAQELLSFFLNILSDKEEKSSATSISVFAIFHLADDQFKIKLMKEYVPSTPKIKHNEIGELHLNIQESICRFACYSRPPVPLNIIRMFITGDYVHYCLPMFNMYMANSPPPLCRQFVESLLDAPVSIQKHGIRLAFKSSCFSFDDIKILINTIWNRTKNISLRMVIYTYLYNDVVKSNIKNIQSDLFKILLELTSTLNHEDHNDVLELLIGKPKGAGLSMPDHLKGAYAEVAWKTLSSFPTNANNLKRLTSLLRYIRIHIEDMSCRHVQPIVEDYLNVMFIDKQIIPTEENDPRKDVNKEKMKLTYTFIIRYIKENHEISIDVLKLVLTKCLEMWNSKCHSTERRCDYYYIRSYCFEFINGILTDMSYEVNKDTHKNMNSLLQFIEKKLLNSLPIHEIYTIIWTLRLAQRSLHLVVTYNNRADFKDKTTLEQISLDKESTYLYGENLANTVKDFVEKKQFYLSVLGDVSNVIKEDISRLECAINGWRHVTSRDLRIILIAAELVSKKHVECILLAIEMLADFETKFIDTFLKELLVNTLENIKKVENYEVQAMYYQKFVRLGFSEICNC